MYNCSILYGLCTLLIRVEQNKIEIFITGCLVFYFLFIIGRAAHWKHQYTIL